MIYNSTTIRVRFDEVDKMGFVYHGNYAKYFHISRTDLLRKIGVNDKILEDQGIIMPVTDISINYVKPVFYDDEIIVETALKEVSGLRLIFTHLVYNEENKVINKAKSTLVFVNDKTLKVIRIPENILQKIEKKLQR
jgi:acyl-CoA thioester hydrolase